MERVTLYNVIDIRNEKYHSVVKIKAKDAKYFIPVNDEGE